ncbi:type I restriction enzyme HsdR N-terminal domain-containing protein [Alkalihalobacterium chitinilyticum]|uniref:Type I restriction enzyme HsdR N-terminal domain-containing protein n=1 Tax=Alkalihalobacterium chitinilyticum TaxID=2980103 RepID=A0ABT5VIW7_9BACI|nr:type I restriction enzyme HsdR N-terminal domain-containing protein [Alkalihalobacterium chitinilyticum]MDE5415401.1 type I restriction enzyme HsdR N-terminal domain-containing protein [Alkalihalobacterium chitinilyticum]
MSIKINWKNYMLPKIYTTIKTERKLFTHPIHGRTLLEAKPEEIVRQKVIQFLFQEMKVPLIEDVIRLEDSMYFFNNEQKGRADIVVYAEDNEGYYVPVLVIECKANHIPITNAVFEQARKYDEILGANNILITNGLSLEFYTWDRDNEEYIKLNKVPTYEDLTRREGLRPIS